MPYEEGKALAEKIQGLDVLWVLLDGTIEATPGMMSMLKNLGGAANR
jgi:hypothetical protein